MGHVDTAALQPDAIELPLPWGPVVRGVRWGSSTDFALLLHEPGTDLDAWGSLPAQLAHYLRIETVAVDIPGHGLSDDPWQPERLGELVRLLMVRLGGDPPDSDVNMPLSLRTGRGVGVRVDREDEARTRDPPLSPVALADGEISRTARTAGHRFVIAAGSTALAALAHASSVRLSGLVLLSPAAPHERKILTSGELPPATGNTGEWAKTVRTKIPKLLVAGAHAGDDLATARRWASASGGWSVVTSLPVSAKGTALLQTTWQTRISEEISEFLRNCMRPGPTRPTKQSSAPRPPD